MANLKENIRNRIQLLSDSMVLKTEYTEELEEIDGIKNDISVARYLNSIPPWMGADFLKEINLIEKWIFEEQKRAEES